MSELTEKVDAFLEMREFRLAADKVAANLKKEEDELKRQVIADMQTADCAVFGAKNGTVTLNKKDKPVAADWVKVWKYIFENNAMDLVQKRLTETAIQARWEDGIQIPGVDHMIIYDLSIGKAR